MDSSLPVVVDRNGDLRRLAALEWLGVRTYPQPVGGFADWSTREGLYAELVRRQQPPRFKLCELSAGELISELTTDPRRERLEPMPNTVAQIFSSLSVRTPDPVRVEVAPAGAYVVARDSLASEPTRSGTDREAVTILVVHSDGRKQAWDGTVDPQYTMACEVSTLTGRQAYRFGDAATLPDVGMKTAERAALLYDMAWAQPLATAAGVTLPDKRTRISHTPGIYIVAKGQHRGVSVCFKGGTSNSTNSKSDNLASEFVGYILGGGEGWLVQPCELPSGLVESVYTSESSTLARLKVLLGLTQSGVAAEYLRALKFWYSKESAATVKLTIADIETWLKGGTISSDAQSFLPRVERHASSTIVQWAWGYRHGLVRVKSGSETAASIALRAMTASLQVPASPSPELWEGNWSVRCGGSSMGAPVELNLSTSTPTPPCGSTSGAGTATMLWVNADAEKFSSAYFITEKSNTSRTRLHADGRNWLPHERAYVVGMVSDSSMVQQWRASVLSYLREHGGGRIVDIPAIMPLVVEPIRLDNAVATK